MILLLAHHQKIIISVIVIVIIIIIIIIDLTFIIYIIITNTNCKYTTLQKICIDQLSGNKLPAHCDPPTCPPPQIVIIVIVIIVIIIANTYKYNLHKYTNTPHCKKAALTSRPVTNYQPFASFVSLSLTSRFLYAKLHYNALLYYTALH